MNEGRYYFARDGGKAFFKLTGNLKYTNAGKFDAFLDRLLEKEDNFDEAMIDLSEADFIDSTNLGFLARISEYMNDRYCKKVTIYSPDREINNVLESVGFDEVFILVKNENRRKPAVEEVSPAEYEERQRADMMLDSHKSLMRVSDKGKNAFKDVVELLEGKAKKKP